MVQSGAWRSIHLIIGNEHGQQRGNVGSRGAQSEGSAVTQAVWEQGCIGLWDD